MCDYAAVSVCEAVHFKERSIIILGRSEYQCKKGQRGGRRCPFLHKGMKVLKLQEGVFHLGENVDKIPHIFGQIEILPVTDIAVPFAVNILEGIDMGLGAETIVLFDVVEGADHDGIAGNGDFFLDLNAGSLQKDFGGNVVGCEKAVLDGPHTVTDFVGDKMFIFGF